MISELGSGPGRVWRGEGSSGHRYPDGRAGKAAAEGAGSRTGPDSGPPRPRQLLREPPGPSVLSPGPRRGPHRPLDLQEQLFCLPPSTVFLHKIRFTSPCRPSLPSGVPGIPAGPAPSGRTRGGPACLSVWVQAASSRGALGICSQLSRILGLRTSLASSKGSGRVPPVSHPGDHVQEPQLGEDSALTSLLRLEVSNGSCSVPPAPRSVSVAPLVWISCWERVST